MHIQASNIYTRAKPQPEEDQMRIETCSLYDQRPYGPNKHSCT